LLWFLPNMLLLPGFTHNAVTANILGRITGTRHSDFADQSWYYYFTILADYFFPWVVLTPFALIFGWFKAFLKREKWALLLVIWICVILGGFSIARLKLGWYINPVFPPLALLLGYFLYELGTMLRVRLMRQAPVIVVVIIGGLICMFLSTAWAFYQRSVRIETRYPIQDFVAYIERLPADSYQVVLYKLDMNRDLTDQEYYYLDRIQTHVMQVETVQELRTLIARQRRAIFVIVKKQVFRKQLFFQRHQAIYELVVSQENVEDKFIVSYNVSFDQNFPLLPVAVDQEHR